MKVDNMTKFMVSKDCCEWMGNIFCSHGNSATSPGTILWIFDQFSWKWLYRSSSNWRRRKYGYKKKILYRSTFFASCWIALKYNTHTHTHSVGLWVRFYSQTNLNINGKNGNHPTHSAHSKLEGKIRRRRKNSDSSANNMAFVTAVMWARARICVCVCLKDRELFTLNIIKPLSHRSRWHLSLPFVFGCSRALCEWAANLINQIHLLQGVYQQQIKQFFRVRFICWLVRVQEHACTVLCVVRIKVLHIDICKFCSLNK